MSVKRKRRKHMIWILLLILIGVIAWSWYSSKYHLTVSRYEIQSEKLENALRIVQLTDLHNSEFGRDNSSLIALVKEKEPDLILMTGDLVDSGSEETEIAVHLIRELCALAPVYISLGNHEIEYDESYTQNNDNDGTAETGIVQLYEEVGAIVLDREYRDVTISGQDIRIGGTYGYCLPWKYRSDNPDYLNEQFFLTKFQSTDRCTILMCHMPVCWLLNDGLSEWEIDCVFSGYVHGGQIILPWIGGVYGPDFGWFPGRLEGLFYSDDQEKVMVLSRGLGSTEKIPRFNNVPEVVVTDFLPMTKE